MAERQGPVPVIPSLINRYYVLDLLPERSFLQHLASFGLRVLVIDWRDPGSQRAPFRFGRLHRRMPRSRFRDSEADRGRPDPGYRLLHEGLLAFALCCQRQAACLALLATPGFHAQGGQTLRLAFAADPLARLCVPGGGVPVEGKLRSLSSIPLRRNANSPGSQPSIPKPRRHDVCRARTRCAVDVHRELVASPIGRAMRRRLAGLLAIPPLHSRHLFL